MNNVIIFQHVCHLTMPIIVSIISGHLAGQKVPMYVLCICAVILPVVLFVDHALLVQHGYFQSYVIALKMKVSLCKAIYEKVSDRCLGHII